MSDNIPKSVMEAVVNDLRFAEKKITKKEACSRLGIAYNTARLDKLVDAFLEEKARVEARKMSNRGKKATDYEISTMIEMFLEREPLTAISERLCRGTAFIKSTLSRLGIPVREADKDYFNPQILDPEFQFEELAQGTVVYSAKHQEIGTVKTKCPSKGETGYWVYLASEQNVAIGWYDLLPLTPLIDKYNLKLRLGSGIDTKAELAQTLTRAFKNDK